MKLNTIRFVAQLTEGELTALDGVRATLGLRSKADVIRHWIKLATPQKAKK